MEISSKLREWMGTAQDFLNGQEWFQELKGKWEEVDPQSRMYLKLAIVGCSLLALIVVVFSAIWSVHSMKVEVSEKKDLLNVIQAANEELHRLRDTVPSHPLPGNGHNSPAGNADGDSWPHYFESLAQGAGFDKTSVTVGGQKAGHAGEQSKETLYEITLKHLNIKQVVHYTYSLENGKKPVKLRNLLIDTQGDLTGYLDATLAVSAFTLVGSQ